MKQSLPVLTEIDICFEPEKLYIILGSVGSGKTSLIHACLGELCTVEGACMLNGKVGYVPQLAFNTNDILRNNITYG